MESHFALLKVAGSGTLEPTAMPSDLKLVRECFLSALELPAEERSAYLAAHCGEDQELRDAVERMLAAYEKPASFLSRPAQEGMSEHTRAFAPGEKAGELLGGRYKLLEQIGTGGMGAVWMAEQKEPVKRKVAVKLVKAGMDSAQVLARFEAERQALALMDHPNIAKVFDGGITAQGRPFFVMEFVKGLPISEYCDQARLSVKQRLELFIPVCQAVTHAHQKGIIHRDLKPSNILICLYDGKPVPKVIDFGLAKAMHQTLSEHTVHTAFGMMVGTPLYMSPEQAEHNNLDVDTRTDVYSLGVILYELLTGTTPLEKQQLKEAAYKEILRLIKEVEPPKPSTRLSGSASLPNIAAQRSIDPIQLSKSLSGDLDWIVMKALDKERSRRYETANGLARDVERFLKEEAVEAAPPTTGYRLRKLVRKHRAVITTAAAFALLLVVGTVVSAWQAVRATIAEGKAETALEAESKQRQVALKNQKLAEEAAKKESEQRAKAEKARDRTREVLDAMTSEATGDSISTQQELSEDQRKFLNEVLTYYQEFAGEKGKDEKSKARTADAAVRIGKIQSQLGNRKLAISAFEMARDSYQALVNEFPMKGNYALDLAVSLRLLGREFDDGWKKSEAEAEYRKALSIVEKLVFDFPAEKVYQYELAACHRNLGTVLKGKDSAKQLVQALSIVTALLKESPNVADYRRLQANSHLNLGIRLIGMGQRPEAEEHYNRALAVAEGLVKDFPKKSFYRMNLALTHQSMATLQGQVANRKMEEHHCRQALEINETLTTDFPAVPEFWDTLADSHASLAVVLAGSANSDGIRTADLNSQAEAEKHYRKSLAIRERLAGDYPKRPGFRVNLAAAHGNLANVLFSFGRVQPAESELRQAIEISNSLLSEFPTDPVFRFSLSEGHSNLGFFLMKHGKPSDAQEHSRAALTLLQKLTADFPEESSYQIMLGNCYCNHGFLHLSCNRATESVEWFDKAVTTLTPILRAGPNNGFVKQVLSESHWSRAKAFDALAKPTEAAKDWERAVELGMPTDQFGIRVGRATSRLRVGEVSESLAEIDKLCASRADAASAFKPNGTGLFSLACFYSVASTKIPEKQGEYTDRAMEILRQATTAGWNDPLTLANNKDIDPLREREDFKRLLAELDSKKT